MLDLKRVRGIEERCLNAWPSLQEMVFDGWLLRFARGYTRRANSVNPIYSGCAGVYEKVLGCEAMYRGKGLSTVFKVSPLVQPADLDGVLEARGYEKEATTSVQSLTLEGLEGVNVDAIRVRELPDAVWLGAYQRLQEMGAEDMVSFRAILERIAAPTWFVSLMEDGETVSAGLAVLEGAQVGLFGLVTDVAQRSRGFGRQMVAAILERAKANGAEAAYLQVAVTNDPALKLYAKLGFREVYRYWYRVKGI